VARVAKQVMIFSHVGNGAEYRPGGWGAGGDSIMRPKRI